MCKQHAMVVQSAAAWFNKMLLNVWREVQTPVDLNLKGISRLNAQALRAPRESRQQRQVGCAAPAAHSVANSGS